MRSFLRQRKLTLRSKGRAASGAPLSLDVRRLEVGRVDPVAKRHRPQQSSRQCSSAVLPVYVALGVHHAEGVAGISRCPEHVVVKNGFHAFLRSAPPNPSFNRTRRDKAASLRLSQALGDHYGTL